MINQSKLDIIDIKDMEILLFSLKGNYRVKPTEYEKDYIINFLIANRK